MIKVAWTLSKASFLALLEMLDVVNNWQNVKEVTHTHSANNWRQDRLHAKRVGREFPKFGDRRTMQHRQVLNRLSRTKALQFHLESGRCDQRTLAMVRKLYPDVLPHLPSLFEVKADVEKLRKVIQQIEDDEKHESLGIWRRKMKQLKFRSQWRR